MERQLTATDPRGRDAPFGFTVAAPETIARLSIDLRSGQEEWGRRAVQERLSVLQQWAGQLRSMQPTLQRALEADTGRRLISATEIEGSLRRIEYWCEQAPAVFAEESAGRSESVPSVKYRHVRVPYDLVGVISPWNFPLLLTLIDAIPALVAGCAVLAKPSEVTPRFVEPLRQSIAAVPALASVFQLVSGDGETGQAVIDHVDAVCFTGSVETGRKVGARAGDRLIPAFLELGGKDPLIVMAGADVQSAVDAALRSSCINTGQACQSIERVYVHESLYPMFVKQLIADARRVTSNCERIDEGVLGPFIDSSQVEKVRRQIEDAVAKGARQETGEFIYRGDGGVWLTPVVLTGVTHGMQVMREETFGPVIPVMTFHSDEEAVALANDTAFGLSAAVIGGDDQRVLAVAKRINAGAVSINDAGMTTLVGDVEKDSFGLSGMGRSRMGASGLRRFLRARALLMQSKSPVPISYFEEAASN